MYYDENNPDVIFCRNFIRIEILVGLLIIEFPVIGIWLFCIGFILFVLWTIIALLTYDIS